MEKIKNNITLKYTIGLSLVTIIILSTQMGIIKLLDTIGYELTKTLLILSIIVRPLVGLYIVTKVCCKERIGRYEWYRKNTRNEYRILKH